MFVTYFSATARVACHRDEARAIRWAADHLIPTDHLLRAVREGVTPVDELAEYFYVTRWMVLAKLRTLAGPVWRCRAGHVHTTDCRDCGEAA